MIKFSTWLESYYSPSHIFHGDPVLDAPGGRVNANPYAATAAWGGNKPATQAGNSDATKVHSPSRLDAIEGQLKQIHGMLSLLLQQRQQQQSGIARAVPNQMNVPMARRI